MAIQHKVVGNAMQTVVCQLGQGQAIYAEAGKFLWKTPNVSPGCCRGKCGPSSSTAQVRGSPRRMLSCALSRPST